MGEIKEFLGFQVSGFGGQWERRDDLRSGCGVVSVGEWRRKDGMVVAYSNVYKRFRTEGCK